MSDNGAVIYDDIYINGREFKVDRRVADELIRLRMDSVRAMIEKMATINPGPDETVLVYTPKGVSKEFLLQTGEMLRMQFSDRRIAVVTEGLEMHTAEGAAELLQDCMKLIDAVNNDGAVHMDTKAAALTLHNRILSAGNSEDEEE